MSAKLTKELADTLCTVITVGFMALEGGKTDWIYEVPSPKDPVKGYTPEEQELIKKIQEPYVSIKERLATYSISSDLPLPVRSAPSRPVPPWGSSWILWRWAKSIRSKACSLWEAVRTRSAGNF